MVQNDLPPTVFTQQSSIGCARTRLRLISETSFDLKNGTQSLNTPSNWKNRFRPDPPKRLNLSAMRPTRRLQMQYQRKRRVGLPVLESASCAKVSARHRHCRLVFNEIVEIYLDPIRGRWAPASPIELTPERGNQALGWPTATTVSTSIIDVQISPRRNCQGPCRNAIVGISTSAFVATVPSFWVGHDCFRFLDWRRGNVPTSSVPPTISHASRSSSFTSAALTTDNRTGM